MGVMSESAALVVEVHVPLTADTDVVEGESRFPWIETLVEFTAELDEIGEIFVVEEGDIFNDSYVIVITGADEATLTGVANRVANLPGIPTGVFAVVTDSDADELGQGTVIDIS
ncbi:aspartyl/glutamyl-tRNA amidotransferase subunit B [Leifsonia rubra CMS 76R]|nr:aspartyl/glutamyl-tRNA amidotransferase subunit B [Leifsonia rubra CMS 76R]